MNLKFMELRNKLFGLFFLCVTLMVQGQEETAVTDSTVARKMVKLDGIAAVVGDYSLPSAVAVFASAVAPEEL